MGVLIGEEGVTQFSYLEYQALTFILAAVSCLGMIAIEVVMKRFQVMPVLFPGMFSVRERRFFFFDVEVKDGQIARQLREEVKMLTRITLFLVLSYLWQHCVIESIQHVGDAFPSSFCDEGFDCFASQIHFTTLLTHKHEAVDCLGEKKPFARNVVISCIRFVRPAATSWLMHMAISHSVMQMILKCFEFFVWFSGNSRCVRKFAGVLTIISTMLFFGLFFGGVMLEFVSSWLSFVMSLSMPLFCLTVWRSGTILESLWQKQAKETQDSIEQHFVEALAALPAAPDKSVPRRSLESPTDASADVAQKGRLNYVMKKITKNFGRLKGRPSEPQRVQFSSLSKSEEKSDYDAVGIDHAQARSV